MLTPIDYLDQLVGYRPKRFQITEPRPYPPGLIPPTPDVPWEGDGAAGLLPGLFGGGNGGFEPSGPPIPIVGPVPPPPDGPLNPTPVKPIAFG